MFDIITIALASLADLLGTIFGTSSTTAEAAPEA